MTWYRIHTEKGKNMTVDVLEESGVFSNSYNIVDRETGKTLRYGLKSKKDAIEEAKFQVGNR